MGKEITFEDYKLQREKEKMEIRNSSLTLELLKKTVKKMVRIANDGVGASEIYNDMLLSLLPNSEHKVNIGQWTYKADFDDFEVILKLLQSCKSSEMVFEYEKIYFQEMKNYI